MRRGAPFDLEVHFMVALIGAIERRAGLNLTGNHAGAKSVSEKFRVFYKKTANDVISFKLKGIWGIRPPSSVDAHVHV